MHTERDACLLETEFRDMQHGDLDTWTPARNRVAWRPRCMRVDAQIQVDAVALLRVGDAGMRCRHAVAGGCGPPCVVGAAQSQHPDRRPPSSLVGGKFCTNKQKCQDVDFGCY